MSSWRSRFRKTKTPDSHEVKTSSGYLKTSDDVDHHKKRRSRFLGRSKHEGNFDERPRPRSLYVERSNDGIDGIDTSSSRLLAHTPTVQEILDRNRRERSASKSPRPWRKFLTGERSDRSPSGAGKSEQNDDGVHRNGDTNHNYASDYGASDAMRQSSYSSYENGERYQRYQREQKGLASESRSSRWRNDASSQKDDASVKSESEKSSGKAQSGSSRSASPYDNVDGNAGAGSRDSRRQERRDFSETSSVTGQATTPQSRRRERLRRNDSQETVSSEKASKDGSTLRKPRASYPVEDGETPQNRRYQSETSKSLSGQSSRRKLSSTKDTREGESSDKSPRSRRTSRTLGQSNYGRRSSDNILGAALNYIERRISVDSIHSNSSKPDESSDNTTDRPGGWRRRYRGLRAEKSMENLSTRESRSRDAELRRETYDKDEESGRRSYTSNFRAARRETDTKRETFARQRPKSLYDYSDTIKFSDTISKFKGGSQNDENYENTYSVWERYKPRSAFSSESQETSGITRRPKTLFMVDDDDDKTTTYRGNWSAKVPQRPAHLKDFSKPEETESSYSWRRKRSEERAEKEAALKKEEAAKGDRVSYRRRESQQQRDAANDDVREESAKASIPSFEFTVSEPREETKVSQRNDAADIAVVDEEDVKKNSSLMASDNTVVRRRKKEHAPPARPSSVYVTKDYHVESDEEPRTQRRQKKLADDDDDYDSSYRSKHSNINLDSEDIKAGLRRKSAVERRLRSKYGKERPKSVHLADVFAVSDADHRNSSYLPTTLKNHDPLKDTVDDVKREFEKLLRRTSTWKLRTESLSSKSNFLSSSYRSLNRAITGIRDESDNVCAIFDNIGERLSVNDSVGYPDTEDEWKRAFEGGLLLAKATRLLDYQKRNPKPDFEYSDSESEPETPGKSYYGMPQGIPWFSSSRHSSRLSGNSNSYITKQSDDIISGSSRSYSSYRPSIDSLSSLDMSTSTRQSLLADSYLRRRRQQDAEADYRRSSGSLSNASLSGRMVPETAV